MLSKALFALIVLSVAFLSALMWGHDSMAALAPSSAVEATESQNKSDEHAVKAPRLFASWLSWPMFKHQTTASIENNKPTSTERASALNWIKRHRGPFFSTSESKLKKAFANDVSETEKIPGPVKVETRLARVTLYWPGEGDYYTARRLSSTGVKLRDGHCAVDPNIIPYGSVVKIPGLGRYVAVDTGKAVVSRRAARATARTAAERKALVIDVYCSSRSKAQALEENANEFAYITWYR
jgi:hypothetical protein